MAEVPEYLPLLHEAPTQQPQAEEKFSVNLLLLRRLITICKTISVPRTSLVVPFLLLVILMVQTYVVSLTGDVIGEFYMAIIMQDKAQFGHICVTATLIIGASALIESTVSFLVELSAWKWRERLCLYVQDQYFSNSIFYKIIAFDHRIDNPDQRITTDIDNFTTGLAVVVKNCIATPLIIAYYTYQTAASIAWFAPIMIFGYFILGYAVTRLFMIPVVGLVFNQEKLEGDFRFSHVRVRSYAEVISLLRGDSREHQEARDRFKKLLQNKLRIVCWHWSVNASSNIFSYMGSVLNYGIVALSVFYGSQTPSADYVATASFNCIMLVSGFSGVINVSTYISDLAGYTVRIARFTEVAAELKDKVLTLSGKGAAATKSAEISNGFGGSYHIGDTIRFDNVTCYTPTGKRLVHEISFEMGKGVNILIIGPSGCGKSSLLRTLSGLWPSFTGDITKPVELPGQILYLPQRSYLIRGTLKDQIVYPYSQDTHPLSDDELVNLLKLVKMEHILEDQTHPMGSDTYKSSPHEVSLAVMSSSSAQRERGRFIVSGYGIDDAMSWGDILSPGEQQRLCLARVFYHKPKYAVLDEATSSVSELHESHIYGCLRDCGIAVLSVGHRSSLFAFHNYSLELEMNGGWKFTQNV